jgi:hypothetical protein
LLALVPSLGLTLHKLLASASGYQPRQGPPF